MEGEYASTLSEILDSLQTVEDSLSSVQNSLVFNSVFLVILSGVVIGCTVILLFRGLL